MSAKTNLSVPEALEAIKAGKQVILVDDEDRENEGDLCMAASKATADDINFMARFGRGLICLTLTRDRLDRLSVPRMSERNQSRFGTNFHVSIEAREGVTTGISAADRAKTIADAIAPGADGRSLVTPGHVFPICAQPGGVLVRAGQTEGSVDLARLAGLEEAGVICEIMKDDGTMARRPDLEVFAAEHGLGIVTIEQLIRHRLEREHQIEKTAEAEVVPCGLKSPFRMIAYRTSVDRAQYLVLALGDLSQGDPLLVRMHRTSIPADVFNVGRGEGGSKNMMALRRIEDAGAGVFVYIIPEKVNLGHQVQRLGAKGPEKFPDYQPALREFGLGAQILASLGVCKIRLMTDNPKRIIGLQGFGLEITERIGIWENGTEV